MLCHGTLIPKIEYDYNVFFCENGKCIYEFEYNAAFIYMICIPLRACELNEISSLYLYTEV